MIFVVGGKASGKRTFAERLGYTGAQMSYDLSCDAEVLLDAQELVRDAESDVQTLVLRLAAEKQLVLATEVGSGIVPLEREERAWRDRAGLLNRLLAERASVVVRMVCGIPVVLKGELPAQLGIGAS